MLRTLFLKQISPFSAFPPVRSSRPSRQPFPPLPPIQVVVAVAVAISSKLKFVLINFANWANRSCLGLLLDGLAHSVGARRVKQVDLCNSLMLKDRLLLEP
nr:hypothetical protein Iba_chr13cCG10520 [Ipomoea batatas]